tara:strand:- start:70 stop:387 length:318 start_codon:yes stop_codon:yes gene_type:complete
MIVSYYDAVRELVGIEKLIGGNVNGPLSKIEFVEGFTNLPTEEAIQAKIIELQANYDANQYQRDRAIAYPSIQEQLDMIYWDKKNGTKNWEEAINKVKADNPKPE